MNLKDELLDVQKKITEGEKLMDELEKAHNEINETLADLYNIESKLIQQIKFLNPPTDI